MRVARSALAADAKTNQPKSTIGRGDVRDEARFSPRVKDHTGIKWEGVHLPQYMFAHSTDTQLAPITEEQEHVSPKQNAAFLTKLHSYCAAAAGAKAAPDT